MQSIEKKSVVAQVYGQDVKNFAAPLSSHDLVDEEDMRNVHEIIYEGRLEESVLTLTMIGSFSLWSIIRRGAVNLVLPFINGVMLGFGEILAHEIGFKYGFVGARVYPARRLERKRPQFL